MNDYERNLFHGECPFNGKKCNKDIDCIKCKTEQKEPSGDMVSRGVFEQVKWERDVAIEQLKELGYGLGEKPKTGHWIDCDNNDEYSADGYDCSVCGVNAEYETSYCPNCGARMEDEL